jgi:hypothetical protein
MRLAIAGMCILGAAAVFAQSKSKADKEKEAQLDALQFFNCLMGDWRCEGSPPGQAQSAKAGRWQESASYVWSLKGEIGIKFKVTGGKYLDSGLLTYDVKSEKYVMTGIRADKTKFTYTGNFDEENKKVLILAGENEKKEGEKLIFTFRPDDGRFRLDVERPVGRPVAEIWAQNKAIGLAFKAGENFVKCVVTGGPSNSSVSAGGRSLPVCCTGCRDAVIDNPAKWIAHAIAKGYLAK